jgi:hypothetical protein
MIPKSLHTVTVLIKVAKILAREADSYATLDVDAGKFVLRAAVALGYGDTPDVYALCEKATRALEKESGK